MKTAILREKTVFRRVLIAVTGIFLLVAAADRGLANGVIRDGIGARSMGRGGTNIAFSDNGAIILDNPAGMMGISGCGLTDISFDGLMTGLQYEDPFTSDSAPLRPLALPELGVIRKSADGYWAYGLGIAAPAGFAAHFNLSDPVFGPDNKYSSFGALAKVMPALACQITDRFAIGATLGVGISRATLHGPYYIQTGAFQGTPTIVDVKASGATMIWSLGATYQLTDRTRLGLTYQSESRVTLEGDASVDILGMAPVPVPSDFDADLAITWPRSVGLGMVHDISCRHRVSTDLIWINWANAYDTLGMRLSNPSNPVVGAALGTSLGDEFPLHWRDSLSVRLGYEFLATDWSVWRLGYTYNLNQLPDETLTPYIPATLEHGVSVGWGCTRGQYSLDVAYQFSIGPERTSGASSLVGGDFDSSSYNAQAHWISVALTRQF
jgi:long-chain fatty acid transport protein